MDDNGIKISEMTEATQVDGGEYIPIVTKDNQNKKAKVSTINSNSVMLGDKIEEITITIQ